MEQYKELVEARDWCHRRGYDAFKRWYDEELLHQARRRGLPVGVQSEYEEL